MTFIYIVVAIIAAIFCVGVMVSFQQIKDEIAAANRRLLSIKETQRSQSQLIFELSLSVQSSRSPLSAERITFQSTGSYPKENK